MENWSFAAPDLMQRLEGADDATLDELPFGVIAMTSDGIVVSYNAAESRLSGLSAAKVIGRHFFSAVAPCTDNFMVGYRFETQATLDVAVDYVFTLRMQATDVTLRLLKQPTCERMYLLVKPV